MFKKRKCSYHAPKSMSKKPKKTLYGAVNYSIQNIVNATVITVCGARGH